MCCTCNHPLTWKNYIIGSAQGLFSKKGRNECQNISTSDGEKYLFEKTALENYLFDKYIILVKLDEKDYPWVI